MSAYHTTTIAGIPCVVEVTSYRPGCAAQIYGKPENCHDGWPAEIEFDVLDRRLRPAPWLANKMTDADAARIEGEILEKATS